MTEGIRPSELLSNLAGQHMVPGEDPTASSIVAETGSHHLLKDQVLARVRKLPLEERKAVLLRQGLVDGRSRTFAEIAEEIGKSPTTARRRFANGLARMREEHKTNPLVVD